MSSSYSLQQMLSKIDITKLPEEDRSELLKLLEEREEYIRYNKIEQFKPYPYQDKFFTASKNTKRRFLCAANRIGKSYGEAAEVTFHLTGKYPTWYKGHRFDKPILLWCIGITGDSTRKVLQKELFGTESAKDTKMLGTGAIPRSCIDFDNLEKDGNIIKIGKVKHYDKFGNMDGYSTVEFRSTQQGEHVLMGATVDYIWLDRSSLSITKGG